MALAVLAKQSMAVLFVGQMRRGAGVRMSARVKRDGWDEGDEELQPREPDPGD